MQDLKAPTASQSCCCFVLETSAGLNDSCAPYQTRLSIQSRVVFTLAEEATEGQYAFSSPLSGY